MADWEIKQASAAWVKLPWYHHFDVITDLPQFHRKAPFLLYQHSTTPGEKAREL